MVAMWDRENRNASSEWVEASKNDSRGSLRVMRVVVFRSFSKVAG